MPGDELWLIGEQRTTGEHKSSLSNLPPDTPLAVLVTLIKSRWVYEQGHQQRKEELGLDHFEGRGWYGLHHHAVMVMIAFFLRHLRLNGELEWEKKGPRQARPPLQPTLPAIRKAILARLAVLPPIRCPFCRQWLLECKRE